MTTDQRRITELDALRGFAMTGIVFMNILQTTHMPLPTGPPSEHPGVATFTMLVDNRFMPIFATLFGVSFALFLRGAERRTDHPRLVFLRRLVVLGVIGILHTFLQPGEVLKEYAVVGIVVLLPASYLPRLARLLLGVVLTLVPLTLSGVVPLLAVPAFFLPPGLFLLGSAAVAYGVVDDLRVRPLLLTGLAFLVVAVPLCVWQLQVDVDQVTRRAQVAGVFVAGVFAVAFLLLLHTPVGGVLHSVFAPAGRMALTCYLLATVLFVGANTVLHLERATNLPALVGLGVAIGVVQCVVATLWLRRFRYGPVEWLWRCLTWWRRVPLTA